MTCDPIARPAPTAAESRKVATSAPALEARASKGVPEASLDPPSDAVELCRGHVTGAPLPDGRPGPHISWTLYTSGETRRALAERYHDALGDEGHTAGTDCRVVRSEPHVRVLEVPQLGSAAGMEVDEEAAAAGRRQAVAHQNAHGRRRAREQV
jgi:hypothetical protein